MIKLYEEFSKEKPKVERKYWDNGQKRYENWSLNGKLHKEDGPAFQIWYSNGQKKYEEWCLDGKNKLHREDGPAIQWWYEDGQKLSEYWYLNDKKYSREEWIDQLKNIGSKHYREQKMLLNMEKYNL